MRGTSRWNTRESTGTVVSPPEVTAPFAKGLSSGDRAAGVAVAHDIAIVEAGVRISCRAQIRNMRPWCSGSTAGFHPVSHEFESHRTLNCNVKKVKKKKVTVSTRDVPTLSELCARDDLKLLPSISRSHRTSEVLAEALQALYCDFL